ncbi:MAG: efflux transporter outer membrane subunit [Gammaproteobacteria bacterium]|nr:efflux transporter outer membrane subunit [Gammaproteobacteria bacterium]
MFRRPIPGAAFPRRLQRTLAGLAGVGGLVVGAALTGCRFEPPLRLPSVPSAPDFTAAPAPRRVDAGSGSVAQRLVYGGALADRWWRLYRSPRLDALIRRALQQSPSVAAARSQLRAARANLAVTGALFYPQVSAALGASRAKNSGASFGGRVPGSTFSLFTGGLAVSYYPDFFGINHLVYRSSEAQLSAQRDALDAARWALCGNLVEAAIGEAGLRAQIDAIRRVVAAERRGLRLAEAQYRGGGASVANLLAQRAQLAASEAELPPLEQQLAVERHLLAVLLGEAPSRDATAPFTLRELALPRRIPVALPSSLLRQRPDIRIAEDQMRYALAGIGIAKAQFYPLVTITGAGGTSALDAARWFDASSRVWSLGASLAQPIFEGGRLRAQARAASAAYDTARAVYRGTVLGAFQQVADALRALEHDGAAARAQRGLEDALRAEWRLAQVGVRAGATDAGAAIAAEIAYRNARVTSARILATRLQDSAALLVALGGAWPADAAPGAATAAEPRS